MRRAPVGVIVIGIVMFVAAGLAVWVGYTLIFHDDVFLTLVVMKRPELMVMVENGKTFGPLFLALAVAVVYGAIGFLRGRRWAWWFAVVLFAVNGCGDIVGFFQNHDALRSGGGIAVVTAFLVVLSSNGVQSYSRETKALKQQIPRSGTERR